MSQSSQLQPLLSPGDSTDETATTPSPPPLPGEHGMNKCSQTVPRLSSTVSTVSVGRATQSCTCSGGMDILATPITPSRTVTTHPRMPSMALERASANSYLLLGDNEELDLAEATTPPPGSPDRQAVAHGWDAFIPSLTTTKKGELGAIDEILVSYANFAGGAFRMFEEESSQVMDCIMAMEDALEHDHDEVVQTRGNLTRLEAIVLANAQGICNLRTMMWENVTTVTSLQRTVR